MFSEKSVIHLNESFSCFYKWVFFKCNDSYRIKNENCLVARHSVKITSTFPEHTELNHK